LVENSLAEFEWLHVELPQNSFVTPVSEKSVASTKFLLMLFSELQLPFDCGVEVVLDMVVSSPR